MPLFFNTLPPSRYVRSVLIHVVSVQQQQLELGAEWLKGSILEPHPAAVGSNLIAPIFCVEVLSAALRGTKLLI